MRSCTGRDLSWTQCGRMGQPNCHLEWAARECRPKSHEEPPWRDGGDCVVVVERGGRSRRWQQNLESQKQALEGRCTVEEAWGVVERQWTPDVEARPHGPAGPSFLSCRLICVARAYRMRSDAGCSFSGEPWPVRQFTVRGNTARVYASEVSLFQAHWTVLRWRKRKKQKTRMNGVCSREVNGEGATTVELGRSYPIRSACKQNELQTSGRKLGGSCPILRGHGQMRLCTAV